MHDFSSETLNWLTRYSDYFNGFSRPATEDRVLFLNYSTDQASQRAKRSTAQSFIKKKPYIDDYQFGIDGELQR